MRRPHPLVMIVLLAGCGGTASVTASEPAATLRSASPAAATPSVEPSAGDEASATLTVVDGGSVGGPGLSISEAIATAGGEPVLVNGILLKDVDDTIWLCESVVDSSPPQCGEPRLLVENYPEGGAEFDLDGAEVTGLQEGDGVRCLEGSQLYGEVRP